VQAKLQLALYDFMLEPDMRAVFDGYAQLAAAAERVGLAAEALPAELERQRREALGDFWVGLAGEREALLGSLAESEDSVLGVLTELRRTLEVSSELAERADRLTARFAPEPGSSANDEPFEIEQYRETAAQVTEAAIRLEQLVVALGSLVGSDERSSEGAPLNLALARATGAVDASLNRAFWLALGLILTAGVTALSVALAYRAIASRSAQRSS
jgi:hypothetical protein